MEGEGIEILCKKNVYSQTFTGAKSGEISGFDSRQFKKTLNRRIYYEGNSISKLQIVIEKNRMEIMTYKQHLFFNIISIQI